MMDVAAPNEWTQQQIDDGMLNSNMTPGGVLAAPSPTTEAAGAPAAGLSSTAAARAAMERPAPQDGGQALRCPRCDSANTKFCYYNNYSLSQPRHFCKACKRYWTRGGTLRNVPVGGGCRKNKRIKKPSTNATASSSTDTSMPSLPFLPNPSAAMASPSASSDLGLLLYSLANHASDVSIHMPCNPYELHQQVGTLGQHLPSSTSEDYLPGLIRTTHLPLPTAPAVAATSAPPPLESSLFGSTAASLFASTLKQQRLAQQHKALIHNPADLPPYTGLYAPVSCGDVQLLRDIKLEADANVGMMGSSSRNVLEWQMAPSEQALETIASESSLYWNMGTPAFGGSVWPDATSCGPSIAPLI
ncbi:hypothetical protein Taro_005863 [Colocasia esculenta]|uniref:Dof zinc finger protein n=1 Tax=Colocasia esculenta TaxID=4460 RepID=A0A843TVQ5_COLES|nr:hypothetical protein [Colocasia esculenta]